MKLLVTGGAGFIGSNFIRYWLKKYPNDQVVNLDKLTYAGNLSSLRDVQNNPKYSFIFVREYHGTFWPVDEANEIELAEGETRGYHVTRSGTW